MLKINSFIKFASFIIMLTVLYTISCEPIDRWEPNTDWGHWRLGQKSDIDFLEKNNMTVTFGSGAPNFEYVSREEFDKAIKEAKAFNKSYHEKGYIVLRYLSTSLNGETETSKDIPGKEQIHMQKFYDENWHDFEDYIGPKPPEGPTTWITIRPDGTFPFYRYAPYGEEVGSGFETWGCPNNPFYLRMMKGHIRAQAETGIDGSYVDWTHIAGGTCYCKYCRENFIKYLKKNLPLEVAQEKYGISNYQSIELPEERGEELWMEWITFRCHTVTEFHRQLKEVARKYNPNFMISGNVFGGFGYGPIAYDAAGNMEMLGRVDDFIYSEIQEFLDNAPMKDKNGTKISNSPALRFLSAASGGKPVIVYATEITPPIFPDPTDKCLSGMAQINIAEAVANHAIFREKRQTPPGAKEIYQFLSRNEYKLLDAHLYSNIAILASLNQYLADEQSFAFSTSRVLADNGISHVMIVEDDLLSNDLFDYDLIILPHLPLISLKKQKALENFVKEGGILLILGECGIKDEFGLPNDKIILANMLENTKYPPRVTIKNFGNGRVCFVPIVITDSKFLVPISSKEEVTTFGPSGADIFADIPAAYTRGQIDTELRKILENVKNKVIELLQDRVTRLKKSTPYVEITTMLEKDKNHMLIHFVNYDVTVDGTINPAKNLTAQLLLPEDKDIKSLNYSGTLSELYPIDFEIVTRGKNKIVNFELDKLNIYGLVVADLE
jgi:hypothetical protein